MEATAKAQFPDEASADGEFVRQGDAFRNWVRADGSTPFAVEPHRYHLYVSLACPWAHRTIIVRALLGLEDAIGMTVVDPLRDERGWSFATGPGLEPDPVNGYAFLSEAYLATDPGYRGRVTVPVLWDRKTNQLVSNSDDDIMRMFETEFPPLGNGAYDLYPENLRDEIDALNERIFENVNDGVYRAGFATTQRAYEHAVRALFEVLDELEVRLATRRYLFGPAIVETDIRLFVTLIRFDAVYNGHFKCNLRRIVDYPNLWGYLRDVYAIPGIAPTVNFDHIKRHYYMTHEEINPTRIVPLGPILDLSAPHGRETVGGSAAFS
jgi:putative glutathione S-transferase